MVNKKNSQKAWALLTCVIVIAMLISGCVASKPKVYHVGILNVTASFAAIGTGFKSQMTTLGYTEGQNIVYIQGPMSTDPAEIQRQAKALVDQKVDLIVAFPVAETQAAFAATQGTNIPIISAYVQLESTNMIKSLTDPGGNLTGVRYPGPELVGRRLQVLLQMAPNVKRVWVGYDKNGANTAGALATLRPMASSLGVKLVEVPVTTADQLGADLAARADSPDIGIDAILMMPDNLNSASFPVLNEFAADHKIPLAGGLLAHAQQGAVFANTADLANVGALAAPLADKVLKGISVGTIPVVTPNQQLFINYKVAQGLGLTVSQGLLSEATQIIR
ncbi:MAG: ABC transporter substrate-binding protein [Anaerolineales bacterium]